MTSNSRFIFCDHAAVLTTAVVQIYVQVDDELERHLAIAAYLRDVLYALAQLIAADREVHDAS